MFVYFIVITTQWDRFAERQRLGSAATTFLGLLLRDGLPFAANPSLGMFASSLSDNTVCLVLFSSWQSVPPHLQVEVWVQLTLFSASYRV